MVDWGNKVNGGFVDDDVLHFRRYVASALSSLAASPTAKRRGVRPD